MKQQDLSMSLLNLDSGVKDALMKEVSILSSSFKASDNESNVDAQAKYNVNSKMVLMAFTRKLSSEYKKLYDTTKAELDSALIKMDVDVSSMAGTTKVIYEHDGFQFTKKENMASTSCSVTDLKIELAKAGVSNELIDAAEKAARKERKGNVYYDISVVD